MDDWYEKREKVLEKNLDQNNFDNSRPLNYFNSDNPEFNHNNGIIDHTKWNYSPQITSTSQSK